MDNKKSSRETLSREKVSSLQRNFHDFDVSSSDDDSEDEGEAVERCLVVRLSKEENRAMSRP